MKIYQIVQNKTTYKVKWAEVNGNRQERHIQLSNEQGTVGVCLDNRLAKKITNGYNKSAKDFVARRCLKAETIGKNTTGSDEVIVYSYKMEELDVEKTHISKQKNGKFVVTIGKYDYTALDPVKELEK